MGTGRGSTRNGWGLPCLESEGPENGPGGELHSVPVRVLVFLKPVRCYQRLEDSGGPRYRWSLVPVEEEEGASMRPIPEVSMSTGPRSSRMPRTIHDDGGHDA